ncbi:MAG: hypothetical protein ACI9MR_000810 [Myxococcota bacterium]|jgi:hypothetical protein
MPEIQPAAVIPDTILEHRPCPVCDASDGEVFARFAANTYPHEAFETASWDGRCGLEMRVVACPCGLVRTDPAFREDQLSRVYPEDLVDEAKLGGNLDKIFDLRDRKFNAMARHVRAYLQPKQTLVDIGSRYGVFPWIARENFALDAHGIELNAASVRIGRQRFDGLHHGSIASIPTLFEGLGVTQVDGFVLDDVLEHLTHPNRDLATLADLQPSGGHLFLRQMDLGGLGHRLFGANWYYFQPAAHMYYFDEDSVRALLDRHGYDIIAIARAAPLTNWFKTALSRPGQALKARRNRNRAGKKPSYLTQRKRAADDMFLVTARKR